MRFTVEIVMDSPPRDSDIPKIKDAFVLDLQDEIRRELDPGATVTLIG